MDENQEKRRPLTLIEKIIASNAVGLSSINDVRPGNVVVLAASWVMASEATWLTMEKTFSQLGRPAIFRKDRMWLAQDHSVDPRINKLPEVKRRIEVVEAAAKELGIVDYYAPNYTIMHTEFCRERAQPGQLVIGADSHTTSAGSMGALALGLGAADVTIPMITGETWLQVPPTVQINFIDQPPLGIGGKDVILYVLGELKRNTIALGRAIEYGGPGLQYLSVDARFAIANMTTELGGIAGVFQADEITAAYISRRREEEHRDSKLYFQPDEDAEYVQKFTIDLAKVDSLVALYPSPDNVSPVGSVEGTALDGCFIGACTTAEEDLILGALVLREGLKAGMTPSGKGIRRVTPGSVPIVKRLQDLGLTRYYEEAGFEIGAPGCSFCVGGAADVAGAGQTWLSSQNRNFPDRMGPGSYANIASAATVAASSFSMVITDPRQLLNAITRQEYNSLRRFSPQQSPGVPIPEPIIQVQMSENIPLSSEKSQESADKVRAALTPKQDAPPLSPFSSSIQGKVILFGDDVDTDQIIPHTGMKAGFDADASNADRLLGAHCFEHVRPEFVHEVESGLNILVAGHAFGCGSSREEAPRALLGAGIKAVIAKSFSFIFARNCPNLALLATAILDEKFYDGLTQGTKLTIDVRARSVVRESDTGGVLHFAFQLSPIEEALVACGGISQAYQMAGKQLFRKLAKKRTSASGEGKTIATRGREDEMDCHATINATQTLELACWAPGTLYRFDASIGWFGSSASKPYTALVNVYMDGRVMLENMSTSSGTTGTYTDAACIDSPHRYSMEELYYPISTVVTPERENPVLQIEVVYNLPSEHVFAFDTYVQGIGLIAV